MVKKILIGLLIIFLVAQLFQPGQNKGSATGPNDITQVVQVTTNELTVLKKSCYDCHSNHSDYPWYDRISPVSWWVADHIEHGKLELNFTEFKTYSTKKQLHKLEEIRETIEENVMPLESYLIMHGDAKLSDAEKKLIIDWTHKATTEINGSLN